MTIDNSHVYRLGLTLFLYARELESAERALDALEAGRADAARSAARRAADLDQLGVFAALPRAVEQAADDLISNGSLSELSLSALTAAIGPGPLEAVVARLGR